MQEKVDKYIYYVSENRYRVKFLKVDKTRNIRISFDLDLCQVLGHFFLHILYFRI